ncbi:hypothetical protein B0H16DRAFT_1580412 [Mycena metata]|uniref:Uncharacterized protein n=1 Tax=Mycena metata TaxID=1033252 RepID=A0AAD7MMA0_9AGAR|nr:hypothetical protein B0H16DRAFT_1600249 [Mycena metata]KAJ7733035.1 hypothetical protein B0H16DRAFT_1580412 [Mycena metata]
MKLNISFPGLFILLSAVLQGHAIAIARLPATVRSSEIDLNKRQIFFKDYANEDQDEEAQNVERRQIFLNHYADDKKKLLRVSRRDKYSSRIMRTNNKKIPHRILANDKSSSNIMRMTSERPLLRR